MKFLAWIQETSMKSKIRKLYLKEIRLILIIRAQYIVSASKKASTSWSKKTWNTSKANTFTLNHKNLIKNNSFKPLNSGVINLILGLFMKEISVWSSSHSWGLRVYSFRKWSSYRPQGKVFKFFGAPTTGLRKTLNSCMKSIKSK